MAQVITLEVDEDRGVTPGESVGYWRRRTWRYARSADPGDNGEVIIDPTANPGSGVIDLKGVASLGLSIKLITAGPVVMTNGPTLYLSLLKTPGVAVGLNEGQNLTDKTLTTVDWPASLAQDEEHYNAYGGAGILSLCGFGTCWVQFHPVDNIASTWDISLLSLGL